MPRFYAEHVFERRENMYTIFLITNSNKSWISVYDGITTVDLSQWTNFFAEEIKWQEYYCISSKLFF